MIRGVGGLKKLGSGLPYAKFLADGFELGVV